MCSRQIGVEVTAYNATDCLQSVMSDPLGPPRIRTTLIDPLNNISSDPETHLSTYWMTVYY